MRITRFLLITASLLASFASNAQTDGPYILYNKDGSARVITVDTAGEIHDSVENGFAPGKTFQITSHDGQYSFDVTLHENKRPEWKYDSPEKVFVMSDPHGNLNCVISLLQGNGVIDSDLHWSFGRNHLIILGDIADRGDDATQIYWLVYQLESEASKAGGNLSFIYGNHEPMLLSGDMRYTKEKYKALADTLKTTFPEMMGPDSELGRWLATRNTIQVIGDDIYVHAGLSKQFIDKNPSIPEVNERVSGGLFMTSDQRKEDPELYFLFKTYGPIWYRGLVLKSKKSHPATMDEVDAALQYFNVDRIFVGHTIFRNVRKFYKGKVVAVNVSNRKNMEKERSRAVLVEGDRIWRVGDNGIMNEIR